jgi:hypothetical protein
VSALALKWLYVLDEDYAWQSGRRFDEGCAFEDGRGARRLEIRPDGEIRVLAGYAWDGCTPKFALFDIVIGIPDGVPNERTKKPKAYYASLLHDALYQFLDAGLPLSRYEADRIFLELLERDRFAPRPIYYAAVRLLGGAMRLFTRWKRSYAGRRIPL